MKKVLGFSIVTVMLAFGVHAEQKPQADQEMLKDILNICMSDAKEDDISKQELNDYIMVCINDELEANDFAPLTYEQILKLIKQSGN